MLTENPFEGTRELFCNALKEMWPIYLAMFTFSIVGGAGMLYLVIKLIEMADVLK